QGAAQHAVTCDIERVSRSRVIDAKMGDWIDRRSGCRTGRTGVREWRCAGGLIGTFAAAGGATVYPVGCGAGYRGKGNTCIVRINSAGVAGWHGGTKAA